MRKPDSAVFGLGTPSAVVVEIFVANHVVGNIAASRRMFRTKFSFTAPVIEIIFVGQRLDVSIKRIRTGEIPLFIRVNGGGRSTAGDFALALTHGDASSVA